MNDDLVEFAKEETKKEEAFSIKKSYVRKLKQWTSVRNKNSDLSKKKDYFKQESTRRE